MSGNVDRSLFEGVATGVIVEQEVNDAESAVQDGMQYQGEPTFSDVNVVVDGDTAVVSACVDNTNWHPASIVPSADSDLIVPGAVQVERIDGVWLVTDFADLPAGLVC